MTADLSLGGRLLIVAVALAVVLAGVPATVAATDDEPNDTRALAADIAIGSEITGSLSPTDDEDWYVFQAPAGRHVQVTAVRPSSAANFVNVRLYQGDSVSPATERGLSPGSAATIGDTAETTGPYYVQVAADDGDYRLTVELETPLAGEQEPNEGENSASPFSLIDRTALDAALYVGDEDWYEIPAQRGQSIEVDVARPNQGDGTFVVTIRRGSSTEASGTVGVDRTTRIGTVATADASYYVRVVKIGSTSQDPYTVTARTFFTDAFEPNDDAIDAVALDAGETIAARMTAGDVDFFTVPASVGDSVEVSLTWDDGEDPNGAGSALRAQLFRPGSSGTGTFLDSQFVQNVGDTELAGATALEDGRHLVGVSTLGAAIGNYTLTVAAARVEGTEPNEGRSTGTRLFENPFPDEISRTVSAGVDEDWYRFDAAAGQRIGVRATRDAGEQFTNLNVELFRGSESTAVERLLLAPGETDTIGFVATSDATYAVRVYTPVQDTAETYTLNVTLDGVPIGLPNDGFEPNDDGTAAPDLAFGTYQGLRVLGDDVDAFAVELDAGRTFVADVTATATGADDLVVALLDPSGTQVTGEQVGTDLRLRYVVPSDGRYVLVVTGENETLVGYDLRVRQLTVLSGGLSPQIVTLEPNGTGTVDVVLGGATDGLRAVDLRLAVADPSVATIDSLTPAGSVAGATVAVDVASDGSGATLNVSGATVAPGGFVTIATLQVTGEADGRTDLTLTVDRALDGSGDEYDPRGVDGRVVVVSGPGDLTGNGLPATDRNGDGLFEDVDGDGRLTFLDVIDLLFLFDGLDRGTGAFLDFDGSGRLDFLDVIELLFAL